MASPIRRYNWCCHRVSAGGLSTDIMIPYSLDIWVYPRLFVGYLFECIAPDFARMFVPIWPAVRNVWRESAPMGHVLVGHRWDRVAMDILDMSVTTDKGNRYVFIIVDCFSRWTKACPLPNKTAVAVADAFFHLIICWLSMPAVIHSDQGREFENHLMQELCLLLRAHKTCTTPYHPASDGLVELLLNAAHDAGHVRGRASR